LGHRELGMEGENIACEYLKRHGYRIVRRNYRCPFGEVDIIAGKGGSLVFCEVKTRSGGDMEAALEAVDRRRRGRIGRTASYYLANEGGGHGEICRFDVIALIRDGGNWEIEHAKDAFEVGRL
jgi:putative endonuclease